VPAQNRPPDPASDTLWYKDATICRLHVRSRFDGNGDEIGMRDRIETEVLPAYLRNRTGGGCKPIPIRQETQTQ